MSRTSINPYCPYCRVRHDALKITRCREREETEEEAPEPDTRAEERAWADAFLGEWVRPYYGWVRPYYGEDHDDALAAVIRAARFADDLTARPTPAVAEGTDVEALTEALAAHALHGSMNVCHCRQWRATPDAGSLDSQHRHHVATILAQRDATRGGQQ